MGAGDAVSLLIAALRDSGYVAARVGMYRARVPALDHLDPVIGRIRQPNLIETVLHGAYFFSAGGLSAGAWCGLAKENATTTMP